MDPLPKPSVQPEFRRPSRPQHRRGRRWGCLLVVIALPLFAGFACCCLSFVIGLIVSPPTILVIGLDQVPEDGEFGRADSILLLGAQPRQFRLNLLSFPRDIFIQTPNLGLQRINTIHRTAELEVPGTGPASLAEAIHLSFDIPVERYVRFDYQDFIVLVDTVGGVEIDVPRTLVDSNYPTENGGVTTVRFEQGVQWMDGQTALIYARTRQADDDYQRAGRQQQVLRAVARKAINPFYWVGITRVLTTTLETDITIIDVWRMLPTVLLSGARFEQLVLDRALLLPGDGYVVPNYEALRPWLEAHFD